MALSNRINSWFYLLVCLVSLSMGSIHATDPEQMSKEELIKAFNELNAQLPDKIDNAFAKEIEDFINAVNCTFGDLACLVQEDALNISEKEQKVKLLQEITQTRQVINMLRLGFIQQPSKEQLESTLHFISVIIKDLEHALSNDVVAYKAFDPELFTKRSPSKNVPDIEVLKDQFKTVKECHIQVQKKSENAGLTVYNHLYRNVVDRFVIQPCDKYNLHYKAAYTAAGLAAAAYVWYKFNDSYSGLTPEHVGMPADTDMSKFQLYNPNDPLWKRFFVSIHDSINRGVRDFCGWEPSGETTQIMDLKQIVHDIRSDYIKLDNAKTAEEVTKIWDGVGEALAKEKSYKPLKLVGKLDLQGHRMSSYWWVPFMSMLHEPFKNKVAEQYNAITTDISKGVKKFHAWSKGGAYYQRYKQKKDSYRLEPRFTFDDLIGLDHAKHVLGDIVKYIQDPERYDRAGLTPSMGYLLYGPTRTGKSMIAEGLAGEIQRLKGSSDEFPFFSIEARYIAQEGNFSYVMNLVKNYAPCVIFIDEIDLLNLNRDIKDKTVLLSEFLSTISGCLSSDPDKQVIIIAATNAPEKLDTSLLHRFPEKIPFERPAFIHRAECIIRELEGKGLPLNQFDIRKLAEQTEGCSYEQLHSIINNAQFTTREEGRPVTQVDIERSLNTEIRGIIYHDYKELSQEELHILSLHMSGHALAYSLIEGKAEQLSQVTIRPVKVKIDNESEWKKITGETQRTAIQYGQLFTHRNGDSLTLMSKDDIKRKCMIELAGHIAEEVTLGTSYISKDSCSCHDKARALYWAKMHALNGLNEQLVENSKAMQNKVMDEAYAFMNACEEEVRALFEAHKDRLLFLADSLKKIEILGFEDIATLLDLHKTMGGGKSLDEIMRRLQEQEVAMNTQPEMSAEELQQAIATELGLAEQTA